MKTSRYELKLLRDQCRMEDKKKISNNFYMLIMSGIYDDGYDDFGGGFGGGGYGRGGMGRRGGMNVLKSAS